MVGSTATVYFYGSAKFGKYYYGNIVPVAYAVKKIGGVFGNEANSGTEVVVFGGIGSSGLVGVGVISSISSHIKHPSRIGIQ